MDTNAYAYQVNKYMYINLVADGWGMDDMDGMDSNNDVQSQSGGACKRKKEQRNIYLYNELSKFPGAINIAALSPMFQTTVFRFFPPIDSEYMNRLQVNTIGLYSMTHYKDAAIMMDICRNTLGMPDLKSLSVTIATSGIGGEVLNFFKEVRNLYAYEYSKTQYDILKNNVNVYLDYHDSLGREESLSRSTSDMGSDESEDTPEETYVRNNVTLRKADFTANINEFDTDVLIVDPPWGGISYKKGKDLDLKLGDLTMAEIAKRSNAKVCLFKLPFNHKSDLCDKLSDKYELETIRFIKYQVVVTNHE